jgi:hypothetical protein
VAPTLWQVALALALIAAVSAPAAAQRALPDGIPNVFDPKVRDDYQPYQVGNLEGNPDFPVVLFMARDGRSPAAVVVALDARNGKGTWSLGSDPVILIAVFTNPRMVAGVYLDNGFAQRGAASGTYSKIKDLNGDSLPKALKSVANARAQVYM